LPVNRKHGAGSDSASDEFGSARISQARSSSESVRSKELIERWKFAAKKSCLFSLTDHIVLQSFRCTPESMPDPWEKFNIAELATLNCIRHRYSPVRKVWSEDRVQIKMHPESFARGAMRECYRVKKLSSFKKNDNWSHAHNYVAKKYIRPIGREVIFEDVRLQMDSKLWAEEFNRHNPPKKIDIMQVCILELIDEPDRPLYHLEHFIEGDYIKYNSNSGFVSDIARKTPQAFSHFTFERSGHQLIVVDIQGVGDLYTDPQIHTASGHGYGDGNLGTKGMALFFHSHICNEICFSMCLTEFDLSYSEVDALRKRSISNEVFSLFISLFIHINFMYHFLTVFSSVSPATTCSNRSSTDGSTKFENYDALDVCEPLTNDDDDDSAMERLRSRTFSNNGGVRSSVSMCSSECVDEYAPLPHNDDCVCERCVEVVVARRTRYRSETESASATTDANDDEMRTAPLERCLSVDSTSSCCSSRLTRVDVCVLIFCALLSTVSKEYDNGSFQESEKEAFWLEARKLSRPAGFLSATEMQQLADISRQTHTTSVLGQVHLDLARYHEVGRFLPKSVSASRNENLKVTTGSDGSAAEESLEYDKEAALYHLDMARRCGVLEAIITTAQIAHGLPHELLKDITNTDYWGDDDCEGFGIELMETAAEMGDRSSMLFVAESYETGRGLGKSPYWPKAVEWYSRAVTFLEDSDDGNEGSMVKPRYEIIQKIAEMYKEGGYGLEQDFTKAYELFTEAAELAMESMRGKLANKLYELAEQCAV
uniref:Eukaryotic elongation factor 2 kinase (inferred by orthology to a C. elegans protein) n=1 Tax=Anisakis simplex TaxID=6269 RepID=A0A0M3JTA9_ANISI